MKILFVEDDETISSLARQIFMNTSHNVVMCPSPLDAIKAIDVDVFDLIILDMTFATGSGEDVLSYIYKNNSLIPVIIHSGFVDRFSSTIEYYKQKGIIKSVHKKPMSIAKMFSSINSIK